MVFAFMKNTFVAVLGSVGAQALSQNTDGDRFCVTVVTSEMQRGGKNQTYIMCHVVNATWHMYCGNGHTAPPEGCGCARNPADGSVVPFCTEGEVCDWAYHACHPN